ncbi:hypothetical protein JCGZ_18833 [Jatropha curcas]|uniref:Uncharacterized protein n=1 Tax=Jatropha curcas TaxID=180498 RepID=A0A067K0C2_JATCU|nr:hypothetical protein JCGZ_18833 [Jatropha curcas]
MANEYSECLNMKGQDNTYGGINQQPTFTSPMTTDLQVAVALAHAYSQFTTKRLLKNPKPSSELVPPTKLVNPPHLEHSLPPTSPIY